MQGSGFDVVLFGSGDGFGLGFDRSNDWIDMNYDYFEFLTPEMRNSSLQLQGPCYPVIFPSVNGEKTFAFLMYS